MWIFLPDADLSIVRDRDNPDRLLVRSRTRGSIERVFGPAMADGALKVTETPLADYRFRASIDRLLAADILFDHAHAIEYDNFKNSVRDRARHDAYLSVWHTMNRLQHDGIRDDLTRRQQDAIEDAVDPDAQAAIDAERARYVDDPYLDPFRFSNSGNGTNGSHRGATPRDVKQSTARSGDRTRGRR